LLYQKIVGRVVFPGYYQYQISFLDTLIPRDTLIYVYDTIRQDYYTDFDVYNTPQKLDSKYKQKTNKFAV